MKDFLIVIISITFSIILLFIYHKFILRSKIVNTIKKSERIHEYIKSLLTKINSGSQFPNKNNTNRFANSKSNSNDEVLVHRVIELIKKENPYLFNKKENLSNYSNDEVLVQKVVEIIKIENPHLFDKKEDTPLIIENVKPVIEFPEPIKMPTKFYSVEPRDGLTFNGSGFKEIFVETESVYFIELENDNLAHFSVINDNDTMGRAIKYKKELLDTACESLTSSIDSKSILTEEPGVLQKEGNKWTIKQKAKIKFI